MKQTFGSLENLGGYLDGCFKFAVCHEVDSIIKSSLKRMDAMEDLAFDIFEMLKTPLERYSKKY